MLWILGVSTVFFIVFVIGTFAFFSEGLKGKSKMVQKTLFKKEGVGLVELNGVIMDSKKILKTIDKFEESPEVKAIVVRINSPGGAVAPSQEIFEALKKSSKPVVASMSSVAASGGYYVAVAAKKIFANPGTITGSIGVIMEFANLEKLYEWAKIKRYVIKTGKYKDAGSEFREMAADEKALLQGMVDDVLLQFKTAVADGRKLTLEEVTKVADGRIFSGAQAKEAKLVDALGTLDDAILEAGKMAKINGKPKVFTDEKKKSFIEILEEQAGQSDEESSSFYKGSRVILRLLGLGDASNMIKETLTPGIYWIWKGAL